MDDDRRHFPPPWSVDDPDMKLGQDCFIVRAANGQALVCPHFDERGCPAGGEELAAVVRRSGVRARWRPPVSMFLTRCAANVSHAAAMANSVRLASGSLNNSASSKHLSAFSRYWSTRSGMRPVPTARRAAQRVNIAHTTLFRRPTPTGGERVGRASPATRRGASPPTSPRSC